MHLIGYLAVILHFSFFPNAVVLAQTELNSSTNTILLKRPANFYRLIVDGAPSVCSTILTSLNKEYRFSAKELAGLPRSTVLAERLLSSDLQIDWDRKITWRADPDRPAETIDFAHVHIADDAKAVGIYRWSFDQPRFFGNALYLSDEMIPGLQSSYHPLAESVETVPGERIGIGNILKPSNWLGSLSQPSSGLFFFNVVVVGGRNYILAIDSVQSRRMQSPVDAYVLELESRTSVKAHCRLQTAAQFFN